MTLLLFSSDAPDVASFVQDPVTVRCLEQVANSDLSGVNLQLASQDLQLVGISSYQLSNCREFVDFTFRGDSGDHMLRVWRDPDQPMLGIGGIENYCFLSGHYMRGYEGSLWGDFIHPNRPDLPEPVNRLTVSNGTINRTLYLFPSGSKTDMLAVEHRTVLSVHQYNHEISGQVEYHQIEGDAGDRIDYFNQNFAKLGKFDQSMHSELPLNCVVRTPVGRGATSGKPRDIKPISNYQINCVVVNSPTKPIPEKAIQQPLTLPNIVKPKPITKPSAKPIPRKTTLLPKIAITAKNPIPLRTTKPNIRLTKKGGHAAPLGPPA